ncbi:MAG: hypothetical protein ACOYN3_05290, partial [Acidimicrobiia bacterium]
AQLQSQLVAGSDTLTLDLGAAVEPILRELTGGIPFVSALLPQLKGVLEVTVLTRSQAPQLWSLVENTRRATWISIVGALLLLIAGAVLIPRLWFRIMGVGATVVVAAVGCIVALWGTQVAIQTAFAAGLDRQTYRAVFSEFAGSYLSQTVALLVVGGIVLIAGGIGEVVSLRMHNRALRTGITSPGAHATVPITHAPAASTAAGLPTRSGPPLLDE